MSARRWFVGGIAAVAAVPVAVAIAAPGDLTRVSVKNDGGQSATGGFRGVTSGNGRYVAFLSAENLTGVPTGGKVQLFVRDRTTGSTVLASTSVGGVPANENVEFGEPFNPYIDISADGRYVVFASAATNLVDADTNAKIDVFRKNLATAGMLRLSVTSAGEQGNQDSTDPSVSGDGSRTVFRTAATNILPGVSTFGVALHDTVSSTTTLVSSNTAGVQANDFAERPTISADGSTAAFEGGPMTTNLYPNDNNATNDIIVKNLATGAAVPAGVIVGATTLEGNDVKGGNAPDLSGTGRYVVFQTSGILDAVNDTNAQNDVYRRDVQTGTTTLLSARNGLDGSGGASASTAAISADGERGAFASDSTNLITTDTNAATDVFARTLATKVTVRLSERADGSATTQGSETASLSGDGGLGVFTGQGAFAADDTNGATDDVYVKELAPTDTAVELPTLTQTGGTVPEDPSGIASLIINGQVVRPNADRTFTTPPSTERCGGIDLRILDGAGNERIYIVTPQCVKPPDVLIPKLTLAATVQRRGVKATITSNAKGRAKVYLQRAIRRNGKIVYIRSGVIRVVTVKVGKTTVTLARPKRRGTYRLRVVGTLTGNKTYTASRLVRIR